MAITANAAGNDLLRGTSEDCSAGATWCQTNDTTEKKPAPIVVDESTFLDHVIEMQRIWNRCLREGWEFVKDETSVGHAFVELVFETEDNVAASAFMVRAAEVAMALKKLLADPVALAEFKITPVELRNEFYDRLAAKDEKNNRKE